MSRREYSDDRFEERRTDYYPRRPRTDRDYEELDVDVDISRSRRDGPSRRSETVVKERESETVTGPGRRERGGRQLEFLDEQYGRSGNTGPLVVRERLEVDEDSYRRGGRSVRDEKIDFDESVYSRGPRRSEHSRRGEKEEIVFRERSSTRPQHLPYPRSETEFSEKDEVVIRERTRSRSRPPPSRAPPETEEKIDIRIRERDSERPASRAPRRSEFKETDVEEVRFRRGAEIASPPPRSNFEKEKITFRETVDESSRVPSRRPEVVDKEEIKIDITDRRSSPPPRERRGRKVSKEEIKVDIRERSAPPPRHRSQSRGALVAKKEEEWIVRRQRTPSPSPPPPPRDFEKEEIIIRRKTRETSPEPEPPREPSPEPPRPPPLDPIYRPPIIQEVITHHRHIDHGFERAPSPVSPPPPPSPSPPPKEENLEIEIKRTGTRNGKRFDEDIIFEQDLSQQNRREREVDRSETREISTRRSVSARPPSPEYRRYEDDVVAEADYYNRKISSRAYPGEAYGGATRDWGLVDVPPGTERVRMDGIGGGRQEIFWDRYAGERRGKFISGERVYEEDFGPPPDRYRDNETVRETKITDKRVVEEGPRSRVRDKMWTEVTKDLVIKEAIEEMGYDYEETDKYFYVMEYLRYEHVLKLVELTEDIRRERWERIREIKIEREQIERGPKMLPPPPIPGPPRSRYDERVYEREFRYDRDRGRR